MAKDLLNSKQFYQQPIDDLRTLVKNTNSLANQRIRELEESGYASLSQAYQSLQKRQGRNKPSFSLDVDNLTKPQLLNRYVASSSFLELKTSSVSGTKEVNIDIYKRMGYDENTARKMVEDIAISELQTFKDKPLWTDKQYSEFKEKYGLDVRDFWKNYRQLEESGLVANYGSTEIQSKLKSYMVENNIDTINHRDFTEYLERKFEEEQREENLQEQEENERLWGDEIEDDF